MGKKIQENKLTPIDLRSITDLAPAPYNPRVISADALAGLKTSLDRFGDISGLVWNQRTGRLVAGHQRLAALKDKHGEELRLEDGAIVAPDGKRFPIRVVDWDEATEKAANLAANNPAIAGDFDEKLDAMLDELQAEDSELFGALSRIRARTARSVSIVAA